MRGGMLQIRLSLWKKTYYYNLLHDNYHDYKQIFKLTNQLLFRNIMPPLPPSNSDLQLAMHFNEFFCDKINQIMVGLNTSTVKANSNYIEDGNEAHLLKQCKDKVLPSITSIVNASLQSSTMLANMKSALVCPLLKKLGLPLIGKKL